MMISTEALAVLVEYLETFLSRDFKNARNGGVDTSIVENWQVRRPLERLSANEQTG